MKDAVTTGIRGLWHVALNVTDVERSGAFYQRLFGMRIVWQPDQDNLYLSSGRDNLALHRLPPSSTASAARPSPQALDHLGFIVDSPESVDGLFDLAERAGARIVKAPKHHRDGSYSFYLADPDGNVVQVLYEPTISRVGDA